MDDFLSGLVCGGVVLFLPSLIMAIVALVTARGARAEAERASRAVAELQALASPRVDAVIAAARAAASAPAAPSTEVPAAANAPTGGSAPGGAAAPAAAGQPATPEWTATTPTIDLPAAVPPPATTPPAPPPLRARPPAPPPAAPIDLGSIIEKGAVWVFAGLAGLALVVAVLFGLREAIAHGWFGPAARFAGGIAVGAGAWFVAELLHWRKYPTPAAALSGAGASILFSTLYAGHARWGLIGQPTTFAAMVGVTVVAMVMAERRGSRFVAYLAMIGGYATPLLLSTGENKAVAFFAYLTLLDGGLLLAAWRRRWPDLVAVSGVVTVVLYLGWVASFRAPDQVPVGLGAALVFVAGYLLVARRRDASMSSTVTTVCALGIALLFWLVATACLATPTDPLRIDPASSLPLTWNLGATAWIGAAWLALGAFALPAVLRAAAPSRIAAGAVVGLGTVIFAFSWVLAGTPRWDVVSVVAPAVVGLAFASGALEAGLIVLALASLTVGLSAQIAPLPAANLPMLVLGLLGAGVFGAVRTGSRLPLLLTALLAPLPLFGGLGEREIEGEIGAVLLSTLPLYFALAVGPFLAPKRGDFATAATAAVAPLTLAWPLYVVWQAAVGPELDGVLPVLLGANTLLGALVLVRAAKSSLAEKEVVLLVLVTLFGVASAVPLQLHDAWLTVGWSLLVALLAFTNRRLPHPLFVGFGALLGALVAARLLLNPWALEYGRGEGLPLLNWTLYTWGVPTVCLLIAARWFPQGWLKVGLRTVAILTGFALVNLEIAHAFARDSQLSFRSERLGEEMVRSLSWGGYGLMLIVIGIRKHSRAVRLGGLAFAVVGAGKVFLVDVWSLSGFARVGAFAGMAVTLLAAAVAFAWLAKGDQKPKEPPPEPTP
ncbi:hypothetical protein LBMAG42_53080 [Deltaproteobacteria bacterium]|nr:hypothetical protein LBMAG42_53080 [Deltaproteobacteria bacterium]